MKRPLKIFGDEVRKERRKCRISQEELASRCDIHRTYIGGVERGERNIGLLNVLRISRALKVRPSQLIKSLDSEVS